MVWHSLPSSCSARKKPRTSSSTLPAGCGREIACGSELFCSSVWRIVFRSSRNCSRCACWHSARQSQFVRCPAGIADRISHACRCSGLSKNSVVPNRAVFGLSCMVCYHRPLPRPYGPQAADLQNNTQNFCRSRRSDGCSYRVPSRFQCCFPGILLRPLLLSFQ